MQHHPASVRVVSKIGRVPLQVFVEDVIKIGNQFPIRIVDEFGGLIEIAGRPRLASEKCQPTIAFNDKILQDPRLTLTISIRFEKRVDRLVVRREQTRIESCDTATGVVGAFFDLALLEESFEGIPEVVTKDDNGLCRVERPPFWLSALGQFSEAGLVR